MRPWWYIPVLIVFVTHHVVIAGAVFDPDVDSGIGVCFFDLSSIVF
jgi:hypothetical protein